MVPIVIPQSDVYGLASGLVNQGRGSHGTTSGCHQLNCDICGPRIGQKCRFRCYGAGLS